MRYAVVSDIHGNLTALHAVFDHLREKRPIDRVWCTGDIVGYGPDPNECIDFLRGFDLRCVAGNHDRAAVGLLDTSDFNYEARLACQWTSGQLTSENRDFLTSLPLQIIENDFTLVHGSPSDPVWEYVLSQAQAKAEFQHLQTNYCLIGHTHVPALYLYFPESNTCIAKSLPTEQEIDMAHLKAKIMVNCGSVGQPRDGDPRAGYALLDDEAATLIYFRVPYGIEATQQRMRKLGLPRSLVERLSVGR